MGGATSDERGRRGNGIQIPAPLLSAREGREGKRDQTIPPPPLKGGEGDGGASPTHPPWPG